MNEVLGNCPPIALLRTHFLYFFIESGWEFSLWSRMKLNSCKMVLRYVMLYCAKKGRILNTPKMQETWQK